MTEMITAYKAFSPNWTCRDFKFEVGGNYKQEGKIECCENGFHACENPLDTLTYYNLIGPDSDLAKLAEVTLSGDIDKSGERDTKITSTEIHIKAELTLPEFIKKSVEWITNVAKAGNEEASGGYSQLAASGYYSQLAASGYYSQLAASGYYSQLAASGYDSKLAASGNDSKLAASGNDSKLAASGYYSQLAASGNYSQLAASGNYSVISSSGPKSVAKGANGTWISLADFDDVGKCTGFAIGCIGSGELKPDTFYRAENGKLVEATKVAGEAE